MCEKDLEVTDAINGENIEEEDSLVQVSLTVAVEAKFCIKLILVKFPHCIMWGRSWN